jgi:hypothetical protein
VRFIAHGYTGLRFISRISPHEIEDEVETSPCYKNQGYQQLIQEYGQDFMFDRPLTSQMVAAFSIFWNVLYPDLTPEGIQRDSKAPPYCLTQLTVPIHQNTKQWISPQRQPGMTPLEFIGHYILFNPAHLDSLNHTILAILNLYENECNEIRKTQSEEKLLEKEILIADFLRTEFWFGGKKTDMKAMQWAVPLPPTDECYRSKVEEKRRAVLNGALIEFLVFMVENDFFTDEFGLNPLFEVLAQMLPQDPEYIEIYTKLLQNEHKINPGIAAGQIVSSLIPG